MVFEVIRMLVKDAVVSRFLEICKDQGIKPNELATRSGVTPSTVYSLLDARRQGSVHRDNQEVVRRITLPDVLPKQV